MNKPLLSSIILDNPSAIEGYNMTYIQAIALIVGIIMGSLPEILAQVQSLVAEIPDITQGVKNDAAAADQIDSILLRFHGLQLGQHLGLLNTLLNSHLRLALP